MKLIKTSLQGLVLIELKTFSDERGFFMESFQEKRYQEILNSDVRFVQDNLSYSKKNVLRGLHYQLQNPQDKLVTVIQGTVFDVAVDIRKNSPTFGQWHGEILSAENKRQFFIPQGFAHGFCVLSESANFHYKCSNYYDPQAERGILWSDPCLNIKWQIDTPLVSGKDKLYPHLEDTPAELLFL